MNNKVLKIGITFYICSILGYIWEVILYIIKNNKLNNCGSLYGPWIPIYGVGSLLFLIINRSNNNLVRVFLRSLIVAGILEYSTGLLFAKVFHKRLWDYTNWFLNLDGYVCLASLVVFGISGVIFKYFINIYINKILNRVSKVLLTKVVSLATILFIIDICSTIITKY